MRKAAEVALCWYNRLVLDHPLTVIICLVGIIAVLGYNAKDFRIDASADTLLLESDRDLRYSREIAERYGVEDFLIIAFTPADVALLSDSSLKTIGRLRDDLKALPRVTSVITLLDVPLFQSPPLSYGEVAEAIRTLESEATDKDLAAREFQESPFYSDLIVSADLQTTALIVNLETDTPYQGMLSERHRLHAKRADEGLTRSEMAALRDLDQQITHRMEKLSREQSETIAAVRAIMDQYRDTAELFLGGVSMIQNDMITFIRNDLKIFGLGVFTLLVIVLGIIFRRLLWIVLPMLCCFLSVIAMMGILGIFQWEVTVISSNFISLQLIMTLAITIHLIVRYREYHRNDPDMDQRTLMRETVRAKFVPCLFATLTTIAGFSSLVLSDIKPVINFGWMMSAGLVLSLVLTFILFPATVMLVQKRTLRPEPEKPFFSPTALLARFTHRHGNAILVLTGVLAVLAVVGLSRLRVENSFIDYFKESTEIHQGMKLIDQKLGGTTPLDVIVQFDPVDLRQFALVEDDEEDDFLNPYAEASETDYDRYWFFDERLRTIEAVHDYLEGLTETGKVLSLATLLKIGRVLNNDQPLESIEMAVLYTRLPEEYRELILAPYLSIEKDEARFSIRIIDSLETLQRDPMLKQIRHDLVHQLNLPSEQVHLAGMMVLYNNMLQSLFASQIKTMGVVALALLVMFLLLFRSFKLALITLLPNLFSAAVVLSVMGWLDIPLDMMTITIAAISVGIAVDNSIHYIHRFREEIPKDGDYHQTLQRCHGSIGYALYYTSTAIIIGFSILAFSNFWPTIYFGLFTGLAMLVALLACLTLLPQLLVVVKPFGVDGKG
ncbi:MAG: RND family transporter [Desulfatitalea sp.]|nr:RND family transporter [Desulfatitalea sp.]